MARLRLRAHLNVSQGRQLALTVEPVEARRDALLQHLDLEAALPLLLAGLRFLLRLVLARFHREPPFTRSARRMIATSPGAQTERRGDAGPVRGLAWR